VSAAPGREALRSPSQVWAEDRVDVRFCGRVPYLDALAWQRQRRADVIAGEAQEALWMFEHPWVLTTGRRRVQDLPPEPFWAQRGIPVVPTERGGLATLHGPGQLVGSLVLRLRSRGLGVQRTVRALEEGLIRWLAGLGIRAARREGAPGVWVGGDKIASVGLHIQRDVTLHGFALNLSVPIEPYGWFVPCGVADAGTTSVLLQRGSAPSPGEAASDVADQVMWSLLESAVDSPAAHR